VRRFACSVGGHLTPRMGFECNRDISTSTSFPTGSDTAVHLLGALVASAQSQINLMSNFESLAFR